MLGPKFSLPSSEIIEEKIKFSFIWLCQISIDPSPKRAAERYKYSTSNTIRVILYVNNRSYWVEYGLDEGKVVSK